MWNWISRKLNSLRGIDTPIGGISWEPANIEMMEVDISFPKESGLQAQLKSEGYKFVWCSRKKLAHKLEVEDWDRVIWEDQNGYGYYLKTHDGLTFIMRQE